MANGLLPRQLASLATALLEAGAVQDEAALHNAVSGITALVRETCGRGSKRNSGSSMSSSSLPASGDSALCRFCFPDFAVSGTAPAAEFSSADQTQVVAVYQHDDSGETRKQHEVQWRLVPPQVVALVLSTLTDLARSGRCGNTDARAIFQKGQSVGQNHTPHFLGDRNLRAGAITAAASVLVHLPWDLRARVMPGIVSACTHLLLGDFKLGFRLFGAAADALGSVLDAVIGDDMIIANMGLTERELIVRLGGADGGRLLGLSTNGNALSQLRALQQLVSNAHVSQKPSTKASLPAEEVVAEALPASPTLNRNPLAFPLDIAWLDGVVVRVDAVLRRVLFARGSVRDANDSKTNAGVDPLLVQHPRVREAMARLVRRVCTACAYTLSRTIYAFIDALVSLLHDPIDAVKSEADAGVTVLLGKISQISGGTTADTVATFLREQLHRSLLRLPRSLGISRSKSFVGLIDSDEIQHANSEEVLVDSLSVIRGYFSVLARLDASRDDSASHFADSFSSSSELKTALVSSLSRVSTSLLLLLQFDFATMERAGMVTVAEHARRLFEGPAGFRLPTQHQRHPKKQKDGFDEQTHFDQIQSSSQATVPPFFPGYPRLLEFCAFRASNSRIFELAASVVRLLAVRGDAGAIIEHFLAVAIEGQAAADATLSFSPQALWIVNECLFGLVQRENIDSEEIPSSMSVASENPASLVSAPSIEFQSRRKRWAVRARRHHAVATLVLDRLCSDESVFDWSNDAHPITTAVAHDEIRRETIVVNLLACIGTLAELIGPEFVQLALADPRYCVLFRLVERLGSATPGIGLAAWHTLVRVSRAVIDNPVFPNESDATAVTSLLRVNANFLLDPLEFRLRRLRDFPSAPSVLLGTLRCVNSATLLNQGQTHQGRRSFETSSYLVPLLDDAMESILDGLRTSAFNRGLQLNGSTTLLRVLGQVVVACSDELASLSAQTERKRQATIAQTILRILEEVQHFVSGRDRLERLLVLDMIGLGVPAIAQAAGNPLHDDSEESSPLSGKLLPLIHKLWSPICVLASDRMIADDLSVRSGVLVALRSLIEAGGGFTESRFTSDCWPLIKSAVQGAIDAVTGSRGDLALAETNSLVLELTERALELMLVGARQFRFQSELSHEAAYLIVLLLLPASPGSARERTLRLGRISILARSIIGELSRARGLADGCSDGAWLALVERTRVVFTAPRPSLTTRPSAGISWFKHRIAFDRRNNGMKSAPSTATEAKLLLEELKQ